MSAVFVASDAPAAPFVFGKLPAHGDFISRGLDDETVEAGDAAVAEAVALASANWDLAWDEIYVETPVWRFLAAPGVLGREWLAGVFLPSVDAVGRQFPVLAGFAAPTLALLARPDATALALEEVEALARAALIEGLTVDGVMERLGQIGDRAFGSAAAASGDPVAVFAGGMLRQLEATPWGAQSAWWVAGGGEESRLAFDGALSAAALAQLFRRTPQPAPAPDFSPAFEAAEAAAFEAVVPEESPSTTAEDEALAREAAAVGGEDPRAALLARLAAIDTIDEAAGHGAAGEAPADAA